MHIFMGVPKCQGTVALHLHASQGKLQTLDAKVVSTSTTPMTPSPLILSGMADVSIASKQLAALSQNFVFAAVACSFFDVFQFLLAQGHQGGAYEVWNIHSLHCTFICI
jgi:hypothetical protein